MEGLREGPFFHFILRGVKKPMSKKLKNLFDMDDRSLRRYGYIDKSGDFTDKGYQRMTEEDRQMLHDSTMASIERREKETEEIKEMQASQRHSSLGFDFDSKEEAEDYFEDNVLGDK